MNPQPWVLTKKQLTLFCHVQPGAKQNQLIGLYDKRLKIQLKTPPVDGKANKALIILLSEICQVSKSQITIKHGLTSRRKTIVIEDISKIPITISNLYNE